MEESQKSDALNAPVFGTHDWIAIKGYVQAGRPAFINNNLNRYFIGTEAPDNGFKPANAEGATKTPQPVTASCLMRTEA